MYVEVSFANTLSVFYDVWHELTTYRILFWTYAKSIPCFGASCAGVGGSEFLWLVFLYTLHTFTKSFNTLMQENCPGERSGRSKATPHHLKDSSGQNT